MKKRDLIVVNIEDSAYFTWQAQLAYYSFVKNRVDADFCLIVSTNTSGSEHLKLKPIKGIPNVLYTDSVVYASKSFPGPYRALNKHACVLNLASDFVGRYRRIWMFDPDILFLPRLNSILKRREPFLSSQNDWLSGDRSRNYLMTLTAFVKRHYRRSVRASELERHRLGWFYGIAAERFLEFKQLSYRITIDLLDAMASSEIHVATTPSHSGKMALKWWYAEACAAHIAAYLLKMTFVHVRRFECHILSYPPTPRPLFWHYACIHYPFTQGSFEASDFGGVFHKDAFIQRSPFGASFKKTAYGQDNYLKHFIRSYSKSRKGRQRL